MGLLQVPANLGFRWGGRGIPPSYHRFTSSFGRWAIYNTAGFSGAEPRLSESTAGKKGFKKIKINKLSCITISSLRTQSWWSHIIDKVAKGQHVFKKQADLNMLKMLPNLYDESGAKAELKRSDNPHLVGCYIKAWVRIVLRPSNRVFHLVWSISRSFGDLI